MKAEEQPVYLVQMDSSSTAVAALLTPKASRIEAPFVSGVDGPVRNDRSFPGAGGVREIVVVPTSAPPIVLGVDNVTAAGGVSVAISEHQDRFEIVTVGASEMQCLVSYSIHFILMSQ